MPKLWSKTIEEHRREVREAILDTTVALVTEHGLWAVTMSRIAEETGIGRATLYKHFPSVEAILLSWHERQVASHFQQLVEIGSQVGDVRQRLKAVLETYAMMTYERPHDTELASLVHRGEHVDRAYQHLSDLIRDLLTEGAVTDTFRNDVAPEELASYCLHALRAANSLSTEAAVHRLVTVTLAGLDART